MPLATTNYDGLLEQATDLPAVTWRDGVRVQHYRERRYFVRCNAAVSGEAVLAEVAATLGLPVGPDLAGQALAHLAEAPSVVVLDNAETPWWADATDAEQTFASLAAVLGLALVASLRGRQRPFGLAWRDPVDVAPLATPRPARCSWPWLARPSRMTRIWTCWWVPKTGCR